MKSYKQDRIHLWKLIKEAAGKPFSIQRKTGPQYVIVPFTKFLELLKAKEDDQ